MLQGYWRTPAAVEDLQERQQDYSIQEALRGKPSQRLVKEKYSKAFPNAAREKVKDGGRNKGMVKGRM